MLTSLWICGLALKKRVFLWRCLLGVLSTRSNIQKWSITSPNCARCGGPLETIPHLLWTCSFTTTFLQRLSASISHRFPRRSFGKHSWLFGQIACTLSNNAHFSIGQDFGCSGPFGWPTMLRSLIETNCMKLASLTNPSGNLYLIVRN